VILLNLQLFVSNSYKGPSLCGEVCPDAKYCQTCCDDEIKSAVVDFIMGMSYQEVNLDEDPCIFPDCGHIITKTNMDGLMDLKVHYEMSSGEESNPVALLSTSIPFSMKEVKACPSCRGPLRNIARYGRIIRRAMLDEATKKFITWSHGEYLNLANQLIDVQLKLAKAEAPPAKQTQKVDQLKILGKGRLEQLRRVSEWVGNSRYKEVLRFRSNINEFIGKVRKEEQPLQQVANHVRHAMRERQAAGTFTIEESELQTKGTLQASALLLKCDVVALTDFMAIRPPLIASRPELKLDLNLFMKDCQALIKMSEEAKHPKAEAEGHIYLAQFCAFARTLTPEPTEESAATETSSEIRDRFRAQGMAHLDTARSVVAKHASLSALGTQIDAVQKMLSDAVFYSDVSTEELRAVYKAMSREFSGTGHWYTCANGHPFTIGECGMPMELARCPECRAQVGGERHRAVQGVNRADAIEQLADNVGRLGI
jgi:hypothetical protein